MTRFYFFDGIASIPFGHYLLEEARQEKKESTESYSLDYPGKKYDLLKVEDLTIRQCDRLRILRSTLTQPPIFYKFDCDKHKKKYHKHFHKKLYIKFSLVMDFLFSIYFTIWLGFAAAIDHTTKYYVRRTISWEYSNNWNRMRKNLFRAKNG